MVFAAFLISFLVIIKGIVQYKKEMETSVGQFMMLLLVGSLTCILVYSWQNEKENKAKVERELQMHKMYDNSFASGKNNMNSIIICRRLSECIIC